MSGFELVLWRWKRPLCQLSHNHYPMYSDTFPVTDCSLGKSIFRKQVSATMQRSESQEFRIWLTAAAGTVTKQSCPEHQLLLIEGLRHSC